jgi:hypothetical protein
LTGVFCLFNGFSDLAHLAASTQKPMKIALTAIVLCCASANAGIFLTGISQVGVSSTGENGGSPIWNTLGNENSFANLYVTQPNGSYTSAFINNGNGSGASISYELTPGTYQFFISSDSFSANNPGYYAINLFFDGNALTPGITGYSARDSSSVMVVPSRFTTQALDGATSTSSAGTLSFSSGGLLVTLVDYGFGMPGVFGGTGIDRVGSQNDLPDLALDGIGTLTLSVTTVPESPTCAAVLFLGLAGWTLFRRRHTSPAAKPVCDRVSL